MMLKTNKSKGSWSLITLVVVVLTALAIDLDLKHWNQQRRVIEYDTRAYYGYLPAQFIYDDLLLQKSDYITIGEDGANYHKFGPLHTPDGRKVMKMTMGLSFLYAPFFFVAHAFAFNAEAYQADGFSEPYKVMLLVSTLFYLLLGMLVLRRVLLMLGFSDSVTAIALLLVGLGTNLLAYASQSAPNVHVYNFFLIALFILFTMRWYRQINVVNSLAIGLLFGLIVLVRPSNVAVVLIFVLFGIERWSHIPARIKLWLRNWPLMLFIAVLSLLVWWPQLAYWKMSTGDWVYYSYNDEGFFFDRPRIMKGLFSWRKGWLLYTPLMAFALTGLFFMRSAARQWRVATVVFMVANVYIIFSWWCWWYGGSFGQRPLIDSYALLAIPLAAFVGFVLRQNRIWQVLSASLALFFIWLNIFQTYQFEYGSLHYDGMSKDLYIKQFGKMEKIEGYEHFIDWTDFEAAKQGKSEKYKK